jgi:hypothetical protein
MYETLRKGPSIKSGNRAVEQAETELAGRLLDAGDGVIGRLKYPDPSNQPPSVIYWTALGKWGILRPFPSGALPARGYIHSALLNRSRTTLDDDDVPMIESESRFVALPAAPSDWDSDSQLDFRLRPKEAAFLRTRLASVASDHDPTQPSLLARLSDHEPVPEVDCCWAQDMLEVSREDRTALERAGQAAALSAIGRGVYAALVEDLRESVDKRPTSRCHRDYLPEVLERHRTAALRLDINGLLNDIGDLPPATLVVLQETLEWIASGEHQPTTLRDCYARAEHIRKGERARLMLDLSSRERRFEWDNEMHTLAEPLHFRWHNVHRLLCDLNGSEQ